MKAAQPELNWCANPDHEGPNPLPLTAFSRNQKKTNGLQSWCKACIRRRIVAQAQVLRDAVFGHYGRVCACPGCGATEDLTIDHVNGGGNAHRTELFGRSTVTREVYVWLIENNFPPGFQVLCRACNASKGTGSACRLDHAGTGLKNCPDPGHEGPNPLPLGAFNRNRSQRDGRQYLCRVCEAKRRRTWPSRQPEN